MSRQATIPDHVPADRVFEFDLFEDPRLQGDVHEGLETLYKDAPDLFYTPANGGHWVATRYDLIEEVVQDYSRFSSAEMQVPRVPNSMISIPLNLDPPQHTVYRRMLMPHFTPAAMKRLEPKVRYWAKHLIEQVAGRDSFDFAAMIATPFPVSVFMELMGLPLERLDEYREIVVEYFGPMTPERRIELEAVMRSEMRKVLEARRAEPREDLVSSLLEERIDGAPVPIEELEALCALLFQAGMDTVANFAAFLFNHLAKSPELQRVMRDEPERIPDIVEEGLRMFGVSNGGRLVVHDTTLGGVELRKGEMVVSLMALAGRDERRNPDPDTFDLDRKPKDHMMFSKGVHLCIGHPLARMEMRILLEEWAKAFPRFRLPEGFEAKFRAGHVMGLSHLPMERAA